MKPTMAMVARMRALLGDRLRLTDFAAVQERLCPKLTAARGPVDVLVIERAEMPAED